MKNLFCITLCYLFVSCCRNEKDCQSLTQKEINPFEYYDGQLVTFRSTTKEGFQDTVTYKVKIESFTGNYSCPGNYDKVYPGKCYSTGFVGFEYPNLENIYRNEISYYKRVVKSESVDVVENYNFEKKYSDLNILDKVYKEIFTDSIYDFENQSSVRLYYNRKDGLVKFISYQLNEPAYTYEIIKN